MSKAIDELRAKAFSIVLAQNGVITVHKRQIPTPIGSTQEVLVKLDAAEAALAECERERDAHIVEIDNLNSVIEDHIAKADALEGKLAECEREKAELKRRLAAALDPTWPTEAKVENERKQDR